MTKYCLNCKQHVNAARPRLGFGFALLIIMSIVIGGVSMIGGAVGLMAGGGLLLLMWLAYLGWCAMSDQVCPICKDHNWEKKKE